MFIFSVFVKFLQHGRCKSQRVKPRNLRMGCEIFLNPCEIENFRNGKIFLQLCRISQLHCSCAYGRLPRRRQKGTVQLVKKKSFSLYIYIYIYIKYYISPKKKDLVFENNIFFFKKKSHGCEFSQPPPLSQPNFVFTITFSSEFRFG